MAYRQAGEARAKSEYSYSPRDDTHSGAPLTSAVKVFAVAIAGAFALGWVAGPNAAGAGSLGAMVLAVWRYRRARRIAPIVLRVGDGELEIVGTATRVRLAELRDVGLESSTIHLVKKDDDESYRLTAGGSDGDLSRVVLELEPPAKALPLTQVFVPHMNCVEERAKIRTFLRREGWAPADDE